MNRHNERTSDKEHSSLEEEIWSTIEKRLPSYEFSGEESFAWDKLEASGLSVKNVVNFNSVIKTDDFTDIVLLPY